MAPAPELAALPVTFIVYESPLRVVRTLEQLAEVCGADREAAVCREISKIHETIHRGTLSELAQFFALNQAKGEIVIIVEGRRNTDGPRTHTNKYKVNEQ